jgi:hypothetical protein
MNMRSTLPADDRLPARDTSLGATINASARSCFALTAGAWLLGIFMWGWLLSRPPGALEDQAGMLITFVVLPLTLALWVVGGPVTLALAKHVREQNRPGKHRDHRLAVAGIVLGRLMLWGGAGVLLWRINW